MAYGYGRCDECNRSEIYVLIERSAMLRSAEPTNSAVISPALMPCMACANKIHHKENDQEP